MTAPIAISHDPCNEVHLIGRVTGEPAVTLLPSGDELVTARIVVPRPRPPAGKGRRANVDSVTCTAWTPTVRRRVRLWCKNDVVEVRGALRRRFWRGDEGTRSRYEVELTDVTMIRTAPAVAAVPQPHSPGAEGAEGAVNGSAA